MSLQGERFYAFGTFRLDSEKRVLVRDGTPVPMAPKVAETLLALVESAGRLVEKDELMQRVWPDAFVEEGNLNKNIFVLRKILGQWNGGREYIETVAKRGYRFVAPVEEDLSPDGRRIALLKHRDARVQILSKGFDHPARVSGRWPASDLPLGPVKVFPTWKPYA